MDMDIKRIQSTLNGIQQVKPAETQKSKLDKTSSKSDFDKALEHAIHSKSEIDVTMSSHASKRLMQRGITLDRSDLQKIDSGLDVAEQKGAKESLFILRDLALVVSVENRTVITALQGENAKNNVFTNIDSAMFL
ncbi:MAG: TIGR02530 family flagellar biosynthesis protein [Candidatus Electryonea clarkiae]|nr:TIGR02530 family flagellar biosynthesis protein [Candidatus Electryonea clarkiae]MDP8287305.1 TIGR02530 family flagellar biosynthesis protein [Candidatus Electryonea clarkiae]